VTHRVLAQIAALAKASLPDLKAQYKDLFGTDAPGINRAFLERRLAYKLQELAYGGLSQPAVAQLDALAQTADKGSTPRTRMRAQDRPVAGTRLLRVWRGLYAQVDR
jgi:hypothetical protein